MRIADGERLEKTEEEKSEETTWGEDEGIYISYNWEGPSAHIVDYLGFVLENRNVPFKLDKKDCPYTVNIKEFMNAIRAGKTVIVVLSRPYLRSKNCMYELSGIMENADYKDRILPVVVDDTIRDDDFYVELVKHWKEKKDKQTEIVEKLRAIDPDMAEPEEVKLKELEQVYGLLKVIKEYIDWANADNLDALSSSRFKKIIDEIFKRRG
jgi:CRISPR/Cas system CSM-associated protein Csm2 small subunit